ncbi:hypothetical protein SAMN05216333_11214 [Nitrosomonas oligotropha]|uniref:Uncharacterized protein n=1 Tax=Nitrosomonas oligotropha TaxID=42354 RepID=A0A1H8QK04_9PROT|nr:hypothetical protein SAMN05216300_1477 [Nitrosomonas oligotropha]SEO54358.1 hypothetical protein SAMN05216333_11214 [Nitrosomonas oligotropha]
MTKQELNSIVIRLIESHNLPPSNPIVISELLLTELEENWDEIPAHTQAVLLCVIASLKKQFAEEFLSDREAQAIMNKLRGK